MAPSVGDPAPEFRLPDQDREKVALSDFRGNKAVVLLFFPWAHSRICGGELCSIRDQLPNFSNDHVETFGISTDAHFTLAAWSRDQDFGFRLLSDFWPHGEVSQAYGVFNDIVGVAERGTFVIDRDGIVRYAVHHEIGDPRDDADYLDALRSIGAA